MSQIGTIISVSPFMLGNDWSVMFSYQLDAGGIGQSEVVVGNTVPPTVYSPYPNSNPPLVAFWASPSSTVTVNPNPPGTTNPVVLPCPPQIQNAAFGVPLK